MAESRLLSAIQASAFGSSAGLRLSRAGKPRHRGRLQAV